MTYDLILRGGRVIDPSQRLDAVTDVAFERGKVAKLGTNLEAGPGTDVRDLAGSITNSPRCTLALLGPADGQGVLARSGIERHDGDHPAVSRGQAGISGVVGRTVPKGQAASASATAPRSPRPA